MAAALTTPTVLATGMPHASGRDARCSLSRVPTTVLGPAVGPRAGGATPRTATSVTLAPLRQMQYPPSMADAVHWYQGYQIGGVYGGGGNALETRLSNDYGTSYPACRVHNVGDYDLTVWVI